MDECVREPRSWALCDFLDFERKVSRRFLIINSYRCPNCGAWNLFTKDNL
jgi:hypothetical protein